MHHFVDAVTISGTKRTSDGYLTTVAKSVRTGEQLYAGSEVGKPHIPVVRVMRPAEEVFSKDSLQSFSHAPVTLNHPTEAVTSDNWKELAVGEVSTAALPDGVWVSLPLILKDSAAIAAVESGKRELSAGYTCDLDWTGEDTATMRNIRINHLAIVDKARAGEQARIGDGSINWGTRPIHATDTEIKSMTLKTVLVDGLSVETTEAGAQAIAKLTADAARAADLLDARQADHDASIAAKDAEIAKLEAERDAALARVLSDADLDKAAAARGDLIAKAKALAPNVVTDGKPALDIKRAVLADRKINLDGKSDAYVEARFDTLVEDNAGQDATREALGNIRPAVTTDAAKLELEALDKANDFNSWRDA